MHEKNIINMGYIFIKHKWNLCAVLIFSLNLQTYYMATVLKQKGGIHFPIQ